MQLIKSFPFSAYNVYRGGRQYKGSKLNSFFQVERKRHIGNDIVNIIFMDGSPEDAAKFQACSIALPLPGL